MPEQVERPVRFHGGSMEYTNSNDGGDIEVHFDGLAKDGTKLTADFVVRKPPGHESLTVVVPWSATRFQMNCKENTRPCEGSVTVGSRRYVMDPNDCHAVQDFGRGMWPYRSFWNWAVCTGVQDGRRVGINMGGKWTTGTGANENAICVDGRLYKVMEDLTWQLRCERRDAAVARALGTLGCDRPDAASHRRTIAPTSISGYSAPAACVPSASGRARSGSTATSSESTI